MIAMGVKFRKSPNHTCDKFKPKIINIPKVKDGEYVTLSIQRGGIIETRNALKVRCVKQEIMGVTIPNGYEIWIPNGCLELIQNMSCLTPKISIESWKANEVLRFLFMEGLRNG